MTQFILFLDEVGAEFTQARANRREVIYPAQKVMRFTPTAIRPLEVIDEKNSARRAAGGFLLLGPLGAALGVLSGKGPTVLFELECGDEPPRKGLISQDRYGGLRLKVERMQTYRSGDLRRSLGRMAGFLGFLTLCVAVGGPIGLVVAPIAWFAGKAFFKKTQPQGATA